MLPKDSRAGRAVGCVSFFLGGGVLFCSSSYPPASARGGGQRKPARLLCFVPRGKPQSKTPGLGGFPAGFRGRWDERNPSGRLRALQLRSGLAAAVCENSRLGVALGRPARRRRRRRLVGDSASYGGQQPTEGRGEERARHVSRGSKRQVGKLAGWREPERKGEGRRARSGNHSSRRRRRRFCLQPGWALPAPASPKRTAAETRNSSKLGRRAGKAQRRQGGRPKLPLPPPPVPFHGAPSLPDGLKKKLRRRVSPG